MMTSTSTDGPVPALRWRLDDEQRGLVEALLARAEADRVVERLHARDDTLWGPAGQAEVADRLGWLDAPARAREQLDELRALAEAVVADGYTDLVLAGMGGSSLAPEVIWRWRLHHGQDAGRGLRLRLIDSTDPDAVATIDAATEPERTLALISTKSGGTVETLSLFRHLWERRPDGRAFVAVTDPGSGLEALAAERGFRATILGDPEIGGRFSALSPFGTVPAALVGADLDALVGSAADVLEEARRPLEENAAVRLGVAIAALAIAGRDKLVLRVEDPALAWFGLWLEQLVAESTGKHGHGVLPVVSDPASHGFAIRTAADRQVLALRGGEADPALDAALAEAEAAGLPILELDARGALGAAFVAAEVATAVVGWAMGLNPFDQPDVQAAKDATRAVLAEVAEGEPLEPAPEAGAAAVLELVDGLAAPEHLALLAYLPPSDDAAAALGRLRHVLAQRTDAVITIGFGPRYLHSTGQLHKGGPPTGRFLLLEHDPRASRAIPGEPYDFATLLGAQALGDHRTLRARGRPALRLGLGSDWREALDALVDQIQEDS